MLSVDRQIAFLLYDTPDNTAQVQVVVRDETIWMTQKAMATLFDCSPDNISLHLRNIYESGELGFEATAEKISVVQQEGTRQVTRATQFYNLDAIISVGYRVNSARATRFRQWATRILNEFLSFRRYNILPDKGRISKAQADTKAEAEYDIFNRTQPIISDFDKEVKRMIEENKEENL